MDAWMRALVVVTCLAVLAATGWWVWNEARPPVRFPEAAEDPWFAAEQLRQRAWLRAECERDVAAWDRGDRDALLRRYGEAAATLVDDCRYLLSIPER